MRSQEHATCPYPMPDQSSLRTFYYWKIRFNRLAPELFFLILAQPVYEMRIIQEPNTLDL